MASSDPSMALGEEWWSMTKVTPLRAHSSAVASADSSTSSGSRARSSFHHTCSSFWAKSAGAFTGGGMPRASAE